MKRGLFLAACLLACGDDGTLPGDETGDTSGPTTSGPSTSSPSTSASTSSSSSTDPSSSSDSSSSGEPTGSSDDTGSDSGSDSGSGSGSSSSSGTSGEMTCAMPQVDGSAIGQDCERSDCPDGYDCIEHGGFQVQYLCGVLCDDECLCPEDHTCTEFNIKGVVHSECVP